VLLTRFLEAVRDDILRYIDISANCVSVLVGPIFPQPPHQCHVWPYRAKERYSGPFNKTLKNPILVIGNTYDPATPFKYAKAVADMLGDSATLVQQNGYGVSNLIYLLSMNLLDS
jgi:hypothetical protein